MQMQNTHNLWIASSGCIKAMTRVAAKCGLGIMFHKVDFRMQI